MRVATASALGILTVAAAVLVAFPPSRYSFYPSCPLRTWTGLACPLCGATRTLAALLAGRFGEAAHRNVFVVALLPLAVVALARGRQTPLISARAAGVLVVIAIVFGIARNLAPTLLGP